MDSLQDSHSGMWENLKRQSFMSIWLKGPQLTQFHMH